MLQLSHISKSFQGVKALQDISMQFNAGEVHALSLLSLLVNTMIKLMWKRLRKLLLLYSQDILISQALQVLIPTPDRGWHLSVKEGNKVGKVHLITGEAEPEHLKLLKEGVIDYLVGQKRKLFTWLRSAYSKQLSPVLLKLIKRMWIFSYKILLQKNECKRNSIAI